MSEAPKTVSMIFDKIGDWMMNEIILMQNKLKYCNDNRFFHLVNFCESDNYWTLHANWHFSTFKHFVGISGYFRRSMNLTPK